MIKSMDLCASSVCLCQQGHTHEKSSPVLDMYVLWGSIMISSKECKTRRGLGGGGGVF